MNCIVNYDQVNNKVKIYPSAYDLAINLAKDMLNMITESAKKSKPFTIALSGGSTPETLYKVLASKFSESVAWEHVHFLWGDERCVAPDNAESNYGMARRELLSRIRIPSSNIHRIRGEDDPQEEASRYSEEISHYTRNRDGMPLFDLILLGLGEDGHVASIFPQQKELLNSDKICDVALHPVTLQKRITLTGRIINNADVVTFLVTGKKKHVVVENIFGKSKSAVNYPAYYIVPVYGRLIWLLDHEAGRKK